MILATLLIVHGLIAVALLGAITHQAVASTRKEPLAAGHGFITRYRGVDPAAYCKAVVVLFALVVVMGGILYPAYRSDVRPILEIYNLRAANGAFEMKEHFAALGLLLLPAYWAAWQTSPAQGRTTRIGLTWCLAAIVWWNFIVGHVLNNIRGLS